ncbi:MAG: hypothetical protein ACFCD0_05785 [Gemmataceae bacterium]
MSYIRRDVRTLWGVRGTSLALGSGGSELRNVDGEYAREEHGLSSGWEGTSVSGAGKVGSGRLFPGVTPHHGYRQTSSRGCKPQDTSRLGLSTTLPRELSGAICRLEKVLRLHL